MADSKFDNVVRMREEGLTYREISQVLSITRGTINQIVSADNAGFSSTVRYQEHLVQQKGYSDSSEYREEFARGKGFTGFSDYDRFIKMRAASSDGFFTKEDFFELRAKELGLDGLKGYSAAFDDLVADREVDLFLKRNLKRNEHYDDGVVRINNFQSEFEGGDDSDSGDLLNSLIDSRTEEGYGNVGLVGDFLEILTPEQRKFVRARFWERRLLDDLGYENHVVRDIRNRVYERGRGFFMVNGS